MSSGLRKESQVVYLLAGVRKIIEQEPKFKKLEYLKFHCDWVLHSKLQGTFAQRILKSFEPAHKDLLAGKKLSPSHEADRVARMDQFHEELSSFLKANSIRDFEKAPNSWARFIYLYARVVSDCPLLIKNKSTNSIKEVVVNVELGIREVAGEWPFRISWNVQDKSGASGTIYTINTLRRGV